MEIYKVNLHSNWIDSGRNYVIQTQNFEYEINFGHNDKNTNDTYAAVHNASNVEKKTGNLLILFRKCSFYCPDINS